MKDLFDKMMKEWERTLLGAMFLVCLVGLGLGTATYLGYLGADQKPEVPKVKVAETFDKNALVFLDKDPTSRLGNVHAMRLQVPRDWIENMENRAFLARRERENRDREAERLRQIARDEQLKRLMAKNKNNNKDPGDKDSEKKPPGPITQVMIFKGFMRAPSGDLLAYIGFENIQDGKRQRLGTTFVQPGITFKGYTVKSANDEYITLVDGAGKEIKVVRGEALTLGVTNPGGAPTRPGPQRNPPRSAPKKTPPTAPKAKTPKPTEGMKKIYQDYLQKGGKPDPKAFREYLKKTKQGTPKVPKLSNGEVM